MGLCTSFGALCVKTSNVHDLELFLLQKSGEKTLKHTEGAGKVSEKTSEMSWKLKQLKEELGEDYTSAEYQKYNSECESVENEYTTLIQAIRDQMNDAETKIDTQIQEVNTRIEAIRAEKDEWKKVNEKNAKTKTYGGTSSS